MSATRKYWTFDTKPAIKTETKTSLDNVLQDQEQGQTFKYQDQDLQNVELNGLKTKKWLALSDIRRVTDNHSSFVHLWDRHMI